MMRVLVPCFLVLLAACSESFAPASAVTEFRVVGARVDVPPQGSDRANPSPGDEVRVSLLSIDQGALRSETPEVPALTPALLEWAFVPCLPLPVTIGTPICLEPIEPCDGCVGPPPGDDLAQPMMIFQTPTEEELAEAQANSVLLQGVVCSNGTPSPDAILRFLAGESDDLVPCEGPPKVQGVPVEGRFVAVSIFIEGDPADPNLNPELLNVLLDGRAWPPPYDQGVPRTAPRTGCAADLEALSDEERMAHLRAGDQPSTVDLYVTADSLQTFMVGEREATEEIQVSWLADGGGYERSFSFITDPATSILTQWKPSESVPDDGQLVRFTFVIRDGRGGTDWVERGLCILPAAPSQSPP
jgi:hypothetical protein